MLHAQSRGEAGRIGGRFGRPDHHRGRTDTHLAGGGQPRGDRVGETDPQVGGILAGRSEYAERHHRQLRRGTRAKPSEW